MIIEYANEAPLKTVFNNIYPDQFVTDKEKEDPDWVKNTVDYLCNVAYAQYNRNAQTFAKNYDLVKGILKPEDFYQNPEVRSFAEQILGDNSLPAYVKHYSILNPPLNTMVGEATKRPDLWKAKAFDDESKSEELQFKTQMFQDYISQQVRSGVEQNLLAQGVTLDDLEEGQFEQMTMEKLQEYLTDYTSMAERWANHIIEAAKVMFNMKEKSEEGIRDLLIANQEHYHVYEDNSKLGFSVDVCNPKEVWKLKTRDKKYTHESYAAGLVQVMEISEIIEKVPELTKKEIDHLRKGFEDTNGIKGREPAWKRGVTGANSIEYDTYDPLVLQEMQIIEAEMLADQAGVVDEIFAGTSPVSAFGHKYVVVTGYFISKKLVKGVTYMDEGDVEPQFMMVDENYKNGSHPGELSVEEGWVNVWYQFRKIGPEVYHCKPLKILDYCPIIGVEHEAKNTEGRSLIDLMKPFQILYNVCMNQLFKLLEKEIGRVLLTSIRHVPIPKDGDAQDALEIWEEEARARGVVFVDDSPENTTGPSSFNQSSAQDLTRTNEIKSRYELAAALKNECWQLVGITQQRLGDTSGATETATATQSGLQQSYTQTEPYFIQHEYVMGQVFQAIVDAAQYIESSKETSSISYISNQGEAAFIEVNGPDLKMRDLKVFMTNRPEDQRLFQEIRLLSQAMLQNGATPYEIITLYSTNSVRQMKKIFRDLKQKQEEFAQTQQGIEQQQLQQAQEAETAKMQFEAKQAELDRAQESHEKELDRINKKEVALLQSLGRNENATADTDGDGTADALEITRMSHDVALANKGHDVKLQELARKEKERQDTVFLELEKIKLKKEEMANKIQIEKLKIKNPVSGEKKAKARPKKK
jgi:hypothetical protein